MKLSRLRFRFSLSTLLLVVTAICVWLWWHYAQPREFERRQRSAGQAAIHERDRTYLSSVFDDTVKEQLVTVLGDSRMTHWGRVFWMASPDKDTLVSFGEDQALIVWNRNNGSIRHGFYDVKSAVYCRATKIVYFADAASGERAYSVVDGQFVEHKPESQAESRRLIMVSDDGSVFVYIDQTQKLTFSRKSQPEIAITPDKPNFNYFLSADGNHFVLAYPQSLVEYDTTTGNLIHTVTVPPRSDGVYARISCGKFTPDVRRLFVGDGSGRVMEFDWEKHELVRAWTPIANGVNSIVLNAHSNPPSVFVAAGDLREFLQFRGEEWTRVVIAEPVGSVDLSDGFSPSAAIRNGRIVIMNGDQPMRLVGGPRNDATCFAFSPTGDQIALAGRDGQIVIRETATWNIARSWRAHEQWIRQLRWSPRGDLLASMGNDNVLAFWEPKTGRESRTFFSYPDFPQNMATFNHDGTHVAWAQPGMGDVFVYRTIDFEKIHSLSNVKADGSLHFMRDGKELIFGTHKTLIEIRSLADNKVLSSMGGRTANDVKLVLSNSGKVVFALDYRQFAAYELNSSKLLWSFALLQGTVHDLAGHPKAPLLAVGSSDGTITLVNAERGSLVTKLRIGPAAGHIWQVGFSPDGKLLAAAMSNGAVVVMRVADEWLAP